MYTTSISELHVLLFQTGMTNCDDGHPGNGPCSGEQTCDGPYTCNKAKNVCCPVRLINTGVYMCSGEL